MDKKTLTVKISQILKSTLKLQNQISEAEEREQELVEQKKKDAMSLESNLRNLMR